jgi:hypothetical protein
MDTTFPEGESASLTVDVKEPRELTIALRRPSWAEDDFVVRVNGTLTALPKPGSYVEIKRVWRTGDTVSLTLPKSVWLDRLEDNPKRAAILWGPLVLAGDLGAAPARERGPEGEMRQQFDAPPLVTERDVLTSLQPVADRPGTFRMTNLGAAIEFAPFYKLHRRTYTAYWDILTPTEHKTRLTERAAEEQRQRALEAASVGFVPAGDAKAEKAFNQQGEETTIVRAEGRPGRRSAKWFSYDVPVEATATMTLVVTYNSDNRRARSFEIHADGQRISEQALAQSSVSRFFDAQYPLPVDVTRGKRTVTIRFQATGGNEVAPVFAVRTIRSSR